MVKFFLKLRQNVRKRKSKFILESIVVFSSSVETFFFLIISIAIFLEGIHYMIPMPFVSEVCNLPDMQARYLQRVLTVILQSTLHDFKYCRSCFLKERFL